jgi:hypothetical protein
MCSSEVVSRHDHLPDTAHLFAIAPLSCAVCTSVSLMTTSSDAASVLAVCTSSSAQHHEPSPCKFCKSCWCLAAPSADNWRSLRPPVSGVRGSTRLLRVCTKKYEQLPDTSSSRSCLLKDTACDRLMDALLHSVPLTRPTSSSSGRHCTFYAHYAQHVSQICIECTLLV